MYQIQVYGNSGEWKPIIPLYQLTEHHDLEGSINVTKQLISKYAKYSSIRLVDLNTLQVVRLN